MQSRERFKRSTKKSRRAIGALILVLLGFGAAVGASGCTPQETTPPPTPSPTSVTTTPALPSNEEALAIVEELVPKFLAAEAAVTAGQASVESLVPITTTTHMELLRGSVSELQAAGRKTIGTPKIDNLEVQSVTERGGQILISAYGCYDFTDFDMVDSSGLSTRGAGVSDRFSVVVSVVNQANGNLWDGSEPWSGNDYCS